MEEGALVVGEKGAGGGGDGGDEGFGCMGLVGRGLRGFDGGEWVHGVEAGLESLDAGVEIVRFVGLSGGLGGDRVGGGRIGRVHDSAEVDCCVEAEAFRLKTAKHHFRQQQVHRGSLRLLC